MPTLNLNQANKLYYGALEVTKLYKGNSLLYPTGDPFLSNVLLHLKGDDFNDSSPNPKTVTNLNNLVVLDTSIKKYGASSFNFNASGRCLFIPNNAGITSFSNLTIEYWCYYGGAAYAYTGIWQYNNDSIYSSNSGELTTAQIFPSLTSTQINSSTSLAIDSVANAWHHFAVTFSGSTIKIYQNGMLKHTITCTLPALTANNFSIGNYSDNGGRYFRGNIDSFRISNAIRYTANFNPETDTYLAY
jgi:hypothetical protein